MPEEPPPIFSKLAEELIGDLRGGLTPDEPRRSVKRATQPITAVLDQLLTKHSIGRSSVEQTIRDHWPQLVGPANASYSHAVSIERNRLLVLVSHAVVRNELFHHRDAIVARIRALPGCAEVKSLNLRSG